MKKILILLLCTVGYSLFSLSIFDTISWKKVSHKNDVTLYMNNSRKIYFYKAETELNGADAEQIYDTLMHFEDYDEIFSEKFNLKRVKSMGERKLLLYAMLDISPMKIRDYYIELDYLAAGDTFMIEWYPASDAHPLHRDKKKYKRVKDIYGRWTIKKLPGGRVYISVEYHNDWKVFVSQDILSYFEKKNTREAIGKILEYVHVHRSAKR